MSLNTRKRKIISETEHHDNEALRLAGMGGTDYPELPTLAYSRLYLINCVGDNGCSSHLSSAVDRTRAHFFLLQASSMPVNVCCY
jgi:hypothetical protein